MISTVSTSVASAHSQTAQYVEGYLHGWVYGFNNDNYLIPVSRANITASDGQIAFSTASGVNGGYEMLIPGGSYIVTVTEPGYMSYSTSVSVSGGSSSVINFYLDESHVPVPEFQSELLSVVLALLLVTVLRPKGRLNDTNN